MAKMMSKWTHSENRCSIQVIFARKDVKGVLRSLTTIGYSELKKSGALVPGFAKFVVIRSRQQKSAAASIHSRKSRQFSKRSRLVRSSGLGR